MRSRQVEPIRPRTSRPRGLAGRLALALVLFWLTTSLPVAATALPSRGLILQEGMTLADPVPYGDEVDTGSVSLRVLDVVVGEEAATMVADADYTNSPARDGTTYVLVELAIRNTGDDPLPISSNDFGLTGSSGQVRRFIGAQPPEPAISGVVEPGESREGWIVLAAAVDEGGLLLLFDSLALAGNWADRVLGLEPGAAVSLPRPRGEANTAGLGSDAPAGLNEPIVTDDWEIELLDVVTGEAVFNLVDYRTGALGVEDAVDDQPWLALRLRITNRQAGGTPAYLPSTAFVLVDEEGDPIPDVPTLTSPYPDASGAYDPGASREGWVAFELPLEYATATVRFLPYRADDDPRFFTYAAS